MESDTYLSTNVKLLDIWSTIPITDKWNENKGKHYFYNIINVSNYRQYCQKTPFVWINVKFECNILYTIQINIRYQHNTHLMHLFESIRGTEQYHNILSTKTRTLLVLSMVKRWKNVLQNSLWKTTSWNNHYPIKLQPDNWSPKPSQIVQIFKINWINKTPQWVETWKMKKDALL